MSYRSASGYRYAFRQAYSATMELDDGREFKLSYIQLSDPPTWEDPAEYNDPEDIYFIDDTEVDRNELPAELTPDVIDSLRLDASEDHNFRYDGDD